MKKSILIICLFITAVFCSTAVAQITSATLSGAILPKKECDVNLTKRDISITGNNSKNYTLIAKNSTFYEFSNYSFTFKKTDGRAKATFTIFIDGIQHSEWVFEGSIGSGEKTIQLNNMNGKTVTLRVKNHSATNKIEAYYQGTIKTNSMFIGPKKSNETITERINQNFEHRLNMPCNGKGTIEITRLGGTSSAEIVVTRDNTVVKVEQMTSNQTSKLINLNNLTGNGTLKLEIRNIQTNQFIRARIGAWFN